MLASGPGEMLKAVGIREDVAVASVPMSRMPSPLKDVSALGQLTRLIRRFRPHILHVGTPKASFLGGLAGCGARVPVRMMTLHGMRSDGLASVHRQIMCSIEKASCRMAQRVYCVSESLRDRAIELNIATDSKLRVLRQGTANGLDTERFRRRVELLGEAECLRKRVGLPLNILVIGFVGRLVRDKGVVELVAAFKMLSKRMRELHLLLIGPFEDYNGLPQHCREVIERDPRIVTIGEMADPVSAYMLVDVIVLPTYREGFPYVLIEAAAMELPVVATRVTGCVDAVVDGVTGTLVPPCDPAALAAALERYLMRPDLRRQHGQAGRERVVREFQSERIWEALYQEYIEMLSARGLPLPRCAKGNC